MKTNQKLTWIAVQPKKLLTSALGLTERVLLPIPVILILFGVSPVIGQQNQIKEADVIGRWYMNSPTKNCQVVLRDHNMMTVVSSTGSFLRKEECIKTSWKLVGNKIMLDDPSVERVLGHMLLISQERGEAILVPQNEQEHKSKDGTKFRFCFRRQLH